MTPEALGGTRLLPLDPARAYHLELFEWSVWWAAGLLITPPMPACHTHHTAIVNTDDEPKRVNVTDENTK